MAGTARHSQLHFVLNPSTTQGHQYWRARDHAHGRFHQEPQRTLHFISALPIVLLPYLLHIYAAARMFALPA
jgi:hypothetical protein